MPASGYKGKKIGGDTGKIFNQAVCLLIKKNKRSVNIIN
jgi:hypothetical protein